MVVNLIVRTWRTQVIFRGLRSIRVDLPTSPTANLAGDTAAALTPLRFGGIPAQVAFFQRDRDRRRSSSVPTLLVESILLYPVYAVLGATLALSAGLEWLRAAAHRRHHGGALRADGSAGCSWWAGCSC